MRTAITKGLAIFLMLCLLLLSTDSYSQWVVQQLPTTQLLRDVYFADTSNGWVVGVDGIFHTTDAGDTWILQVPKSSDRGRIAGVSSTECWVNGFSDTLLHTTDAGGNWSKLSTRSFFDLDSVRFLSRVFFLDSLTGWVAVYGWKNKLQVTRLGNTTDRGATWVERDINSEGFAPDIPLVFVQFINQDTGWATCDLCSVYRTTNGGVTWDSLTFIGYTQKTDMQFVDGKHGWICSDGPVLSSEVWKSTDGGWTWASAMTFECSDATTHVGFSDTSNGWVVQSTCINGAHTEIWHTSDGGVAWDLQLAFYPSYYYRASRVFFVDKYHGWIAGESGVVLHTSNGGLTAFEEEKSRIPKEFSLEPNYPNPFNGTTTIKFSLPEIAYVVVEVYDVLGRRVRTLIDGTMTAQTGEVQWNGRDHSGTELGSGVYLLRFLSIGKAGNSFHGINKLVLLR